MKFGLGKRRGSDVAIVTGDSSSDTGKCADKLWHFLCTCTVVFLLKDQSRWSWHHKMMSQWSLMLFGRKVLKDTTQEPQGCHLGFWYWMVGSIDKSQTLYSSYIGVSHGAEYNQNELYTLFIHMHVPRTFWELFSQYDLNCLMLVR